ncbi:hypothetical protein, partial [Pseudomonas aeruginosa]|uniref:hypothetical protein n=1 Tax=Pseudomonas aeruginosa TaxID=287 RepID=UPI003EBD97E9
FYSGFAELFVLAASDLLPLLLLLPMTEVVVLGGIRRPPGSGVQALGVASPCVEAASTPINCELMVSRPFFSRQRIRCPGERPARDGGAGGSGLCGSSEREVSALLLKSKK